VTALKARLFLKRQKVYFYNTFFVPRRMFGPGFTGSGRVMFSGKGVGETRGLYYEVQDLVFKIVDAFFERSGRSSFVCGVFNKEFSTDRFGWYIKKKSALEAFEVVSALVLLEKEGLRRQALLLDTPLNRFIVNEYFRADGPIEFMWMGGPGVFLMELLGYYCSLFKRILRGGLTAAPRKDIVFYREAIWGLHRPTFRDDFMIDGRHFRKEDVVFYSRFSASFRAAAAAELKKAGYKLVDINRCALNVRRLREFVRLYVLHPLFVSIPLCFDKTKRIAPVMRFYEEGLPHFLFLSTFSPLFHISAVSDAEIAETIMMNRFNTVNVMCQWNDWNVARDVVNAYSMHNIFYAWGDSQHVLKRDLFLNDKVRNVGCMFLGAMHNIKPSSWISAGRRNILMCDNGFSSSIYLTEKMYMEFLSLAAAIIDEFKDAHVIFKPKNSRRHVISMFLEEGTKREYLKTMDLLEKTGRLTYVDPDTNQAEPLMAVSEAVITMGLASASTIAILGGKEGLFYDTTGNDFHPFARYKGKVVFDDSRELISFLRKVLDGKETVFNYIDRDLLDMYDPFRDGCARERLIEALHEDARILGGPSGGRKGS
jgi:hypothetical protein